MANQEHLDILKQGVEVWNKWRQDHPDIQPDLGGANLAEANLSRANLAAINLKRANLYRADLTQAYLPHVNLRSASLSKAILVDAQMYGADLQGADLKEANLSRADLRNANLSGQYFELRLGDPSTLSSVEVFDVGLKVADEIVEINQEIIALDNNKMTYSKISTNFLGADLSGANLSAANLSGANLYRVNLSRVNLKSANLSGAYLVETNLENADLTYCSVYGASVWNANLKGAIQSNLRITDTKSIISVDDLEIAQFIYLLLNHKKLRDVFNTMTERGVLILGRFGGGGIQVLQAIAARLKEENYLPIIFDFERPQDRNYTETIKTLVGLSRFVIADLSGPSVPQELYATVPHFKIPFVPIIEASRKSFAMVLDLLEYPWVVRPPVTFTTTEELLEQLPAKVIAPAEEKHQARQKLLDELFNQA